MKKIFIFLMMVLFLVGTVFAIPNPAPIYCENMGYNYNDTHCIFSDGESCELWDFYNGECGQNYIIELTCKKIGESMPPGYECCEGLKSVGVSSPGPNNTCIQSVGSWPICIACGDGICDNNENKCNCPEDCETETSPQKICCHIYGLGIMMEKVNSKYKWMKEDECVVPEDLVGGGREIVENKYCIDKKIIQAKNKIRAHVQAGECPDNCTCTGSVTKCWINGGREMTVRAGNSGNIIVQVKGVNMTTNVTLYKANKTLYGVFKNNKTKEIKVFPDEVKEKIRQRIKARLEAHNITLDEDGIYQVQTKKRARLFFLIPVKEKVKAQVHSETGEIIKIRNPWWGFLARDIKE